MDSNELKSVVQRAQNNDRDALTELYNEYYNSIYFFAFKIVKNKEDALDVLQDTFVSVFQNIQNLQKPEAFKTWICQIALNHSRRLLGKNKETSAPEDMENILQQKEDTDEDFIPHSALDHSETRKMIMDLIDKLPELQRTTVMLHYYEELSVEEVAKVMDCPVPTVKSRLIYARRQIRSGVEGYEKKGVKLYSLGSVPILILLLKQAAQENAVPINIAKSVLSHANAPADASGSISSAGNMPSVQAGVSRAEEAGGKMAANFLKSNIGKVAAWSLKTKIIAVAVTGSIVAAGVAAPIIAANAADNGAPGPETAYVSHDIPQSSGPESSAASGAPSQSDPSSTRPDPPEVKNPGISSIPGKTDSSVYSSSSNFQNGPGTTGAPDNLPTADGCGNTAANLNNSGIAAYSDGCVYYSNPNDNGSLYKIYSDGTNKTKLNDLSSCEINLVGDWVYYISASKIRRIQRNGMQDETVSAGSDVVINTSHMMVYGDWIYFSNNQSILCRMKTDGSNYTVLSDNPVRNDFIVTDNYIYFDDAYSSKTYRMLPDGTNQVTLNLDMAQECQIGQKIYYLNITDRNIYSMNLDGSGIVKIYDHINNYLNTNGSSLFFQNIGGLICKINPDGSGYTVLNNSASSNINIAGDWIYYQNTLDSRNYRMQWDGSGNHVVD